MKDSSICYFFFAHSVDKTYFFMNFWNERIFLIILAIHILCEFISICFWMIKNAQSENKASFFC